MEISLNECEHDYQSISDSLGTEFYYCTQCVHCGNIKQSNWANEKWHTDFIRSEAKKYMYSYFDVSL